MPGQPTLEELMASHHLATISPEIALCVSALLVLLAGTFFSDNVQRRLLPLLAIAGALGSGAATLWLWNKNLVFGPATTAIYSADNFSLFFKIIFLVGLIVTVLVSSRFSHARVGDEHSVSGEYYTLLMFSTVGMMMVAGARDLLVIFLGIETLSIALYILAGFARRKLRSNEAALKYLLLGGFATGFLLYGIALIYFSTGSTLLPTIAQFLSGAGVGDAPLANFSSAAFYLGVAFMLIGLGFKAAAVPFHQWTPDVYEGAPTPVTAFMATGAKAAAFAALLRVFPGALGEPAVSAHWHHLVLVIAVLTMTIGNVVAISQNSVKRMLAYSSIAHAGYLLVGVLTVGAATRNASLLGMEGALTRAYSSVLFYMFVYALMNLGAFAVLIHLENQRAASQRDAGNAAFDEEDTNLQMSDLRGMASRSPLMAAALTVFLVSLAGIPPTAGFFGKFSIFLEAMQQGLLGLVIVGVLNSVISLYYYLRPVVEMYSAADDAAPALSAAAIGEGVAIRSGGFSIGVALAISLCVIGVLGMIALQALLYPYLLEAVPLMVAGP